MLTDGLISIWELNDDGKLGRIQDELGIIIDPININHLFEPIEADEPITIGD